MIKYIILFVPFLLFGISNPYDNLKKNEKINLLLNYFINREISLKIPPKPIREVVKENGTINFNKYERYFSYIQRLKAINEGSIEEQSKFDEVYLGKLGFYNGKLKALKEFYHKKTNLLPILQTSFNNTFKVIYGKPKLKDVYYDKKKQKLFATLWIDDIYGLNNWKSRLIQLNIPKADIENFIKKYRSSKIEILFTFNYKRKLIKLQGIEVSFNHKKYNGKFLSLEKNTLKLNIKIDDTLF